MELKKELANIVKYSIGTMLYFLGYAMLTLYVKQVLVYVLVKNFYPYLPNHSLAETILFLLIAASAFIVLKALGFSYNPFHSTKGLIPK